MRDDWDQITVVDGFTDWLAVTERALAMAFAEEQAEIERALLFGNGTGAPLGILAMADLPEPTEADRAFAILEPHLGDVPLYRPKYARGGILPKGFGATADRPPALRDPHWRVHP